MSFNIPDRMEVRVSLPHDGRGLVGRSCPKCKKLFKVKLGTGLKGKNLPCHCPYCGHIGAQDRFYTKDQVEYLKSIAMHHFTDLLHSELKKLEFDHPPRGSFGVGISLKVKAQSPEPIRYYHEKKLETDVVCDVCALVYAIYGEFAFCPDCGSHNSITILNKNIEFVEKMVVLAASQEREIAERLVGDALENLVSAFDGFGREVCRVAAPKASDADEAKDVRFQNLLGAQSRIQKLFGVNLSSFVSPDAWTFVCRCFQKRHLLAHKLGVVDKDYIQATRDGSAIVGRKISVTPPEVKRLGTLLGQVGGQLTKHLLV